MLGFRKTRGQKQEEEERAKAEEARVKAEEEDRAEAEYMKKVKERQEVTLECGQMVKVKADGRIGCVRSVQWIRDPACQSSLYTNRACAREEALKSLVSRSTLDVRVADPKTEDGYRIIEFYEWELEAIPDLPKT